MSDEGRGDENFIRFLADERPIHQRRTRLHEPAAPGVMVGLAGNNDLHDPVLFKDEEPPTCRDGLALYWNANDTTFPFLGPLCHLLPLPVLALLCLSRTTAVVPVDPQQETSALPTGPVAILRKIPSQ